MSRNGRGSRGAEEPRSIPAPQLPSTPAPKHTLVLGLGNPILGDDGVGWRVVEQAQELIRNGDTSRQQDEATEVVTTNVEFDCFALGGLALMERLIGFDRAILVDAIQTRGGDPGAIYRLTLDDLPTLHANSTHDASLKAALTLGRQLGARLPEEIVIYAIEAAKVLDFGESLSPPIAASVARAAEMVLDELADSKWQMADGR